MSQSGTPDSGPASKVLLSVGAEGADARSHPRHEQPALANPYLRGEANRELPEIVASQDLHMFACIGDLEAECLHDTPPRTCRNLCGALVGAGCINVMHTSCSFDIFKDK